MRGGRGKRGRSTRGDAPHIPKVDDTEYGRYPPTNKTKRARRNGRALLVVAGKP